MYTSGCDTIALLYVILGTRSFDCMYMYIHVRMYILRNFSSRVEQHSTSGYCPGLFGQDRPFVLLNSRGRMKDDDCLRTKFRQIMMMTVGNHRARQITEGQA